MLRQKGIKRFENALDVVTLIRTQARLRSLEFHFFTKQQRQLHRLNRVNYLNKTSSEPSSGSDKTNLSVLLGYEINSQTDLNLFKDIYKPIKDEEKSQMERQETSIDAVRMSPN